MRMKMVCDDRTLREVANEFLALKKAQKVRERTLSDYKKYIDKFLAQSQNLKGKTTYFHCRGDGGVLGGRFQILVTKSVLRLRDSRNY